MKKRLATYLTGLMAGSVLLGACSRPVAYFQRSSVEHHASATPTAAATMVDQPEAAAQPIVMAEPVTVPANAVAMQPTEAVERLEAYARNDSKLASNKRLTKRLERVKTLLAQSSTQQQLASATTTHKTTAMERLITKKLDRKISKHLAPNQPQKPMINGGLLTGSLILLLAGVLLLLLSSGTAATIGLIAAIVGAIGLIFGLLAS